MRIIAGTARSLPLRAPEGLDTRPTSDQIKETLFNMLQYDIPGCYFLDLFAGSRQIGLESLSRGGEYSVFVENNRKAAKCIEENIKFTKFDKNARLVVSDVVSALYTLEGKYKFDIVFMDPPYNKGLVTPALKVIHDRQLLSDDGIIVIERDGEEDSFETNSFQVLKERKYGRTIITVLTKR